MKKKRLYSIIKYIVVIFTLIVALFPIYWMVITSFKKANEIYQREPTFWPSNFVFENYFDLFTKTTYLKGLVNSLSIALVVSSFTIILAVPASYAIARLRFKGKKLASRSVLFTYLIPASVLYIPLFVMMTQLGLTNSRLGLMMIYPTFTVPYATWILIPNLASIPMELEEAAKIDGCSRFRSMFNIVLPLAAPGIMTTFIFSFTQCWGEFLYAFVNISNKEMRTYPLVINSLIWGDLYPWGQIMAGGVVACLPILVIYIFASNKVVGGLTAGGVKQ